MPISSMGRAIPQAGRTCSPPSRSMPNPETLFGLEGRWTDVPEGAYDPAARAAELDREGIEAEILYTTVGLGLFGIKDLEFRHACFRAFNDWLAEHCAGAPNRLFGVAMIAIDDIDRSVAELERCVDMGLRGAMISIGQRSGESYGDARFEKFWSAVEALEVPISLHVAATETSWTNTGSQVRRFQLRVHAHDVRNHLDDLLRAVRSPPESEGPVGGERRLLAARRPRADGRPLDARQALGAGQRCKQPASPRAVRRARSFTTTSPARSCATARRSSIGRSSVGKT